MADNDGALVLRRKKPEPSFANYGNGAVYISARLQRDGFDRLALLVATRQLSAQFAKELAATVPAKHLSAVTDRAVILGPRRPLTWDWEFALTLPIED